ncbi:MAG: nucleotidyltransferase, partial [Oscillospiraceae bacterium]|nr:nucleotidyltransferase [Oscillospiraceae bacterium]
RAIYDFLAVPRPENEFCMVGYRLRNTVTENGGVSRGICEVEDGFLRSVTERVDIRQRGEAAVYVEDGAEYPLTGDETASMNFWGFSRVMPELLWEHFPAFLADTGRGDPTKREYYLPEVVGALLREGLASVRVLHCDEVWHGVTYREDLPSVREAIEALKAAGVYPEALWE